MSKTRYRWWGYVKAVIRAYPELSARLRELRAAGVSQHTGAPGGHTGGAGRPTEAIATRTLPAQEQKELDAVEAAMEATKRLPDGEARLRLIDLVFWRQSHTLSGAAQQLHISYRSARRRQAAFILLVGQNLGLVKKLAPKSQKDDVE